MARCSMYSLGANAVKRTLARWLFPLAIICAAPAPRTVAAHFLVEDFEGFAHQSVSMRMYGVSFEATGSLSIQDGEVLFGPGATYGSLNSKKWLGTPLGSHSGHVGSLKTTFASNGFAVEWVHVWTSSDGGSTAAPGVVTFTGVKHDGSTVTKSFTVSPGSSGGTSYAVLNFGESWRAIELRELQVSVSAPINYVGIDNFNYTVDGFGSCADDACGIGGECIDDGVGGYTCACYPGFSGSSCEINFDDCAPNPCEHGGVCMDGANRYMCYCLAGYSGARCELNVDDCAPKPCRNGGICNDGIADYTCSCAPGYSGSNCSTNINECAPNPCLNGGICVDGIAAYSCNCPAGYAGTRCQINVDDCAPNPCLNDGHCMDGVNAFVCDCPPGFTGTKCQDDIDDCVNLPCANGGSCVDGIDSYTCICPTGFAGLLCDVNVDDCSPGLCQNGGLCSDVINGYVCSCPVGFSGEHCESNVNDCADAPCVNGATCVDALGTYSCTCRAGFTGPHCAVEVNECATDPCQNRGRCSDLVNDYQCTCLPGFTGKSCESNINDCEPLPCQNQGACTDAVAGYTCSCLAGYSGERCECQDSDDDTCLECQGESAPASDGPDRDDDGLCDAGDLDDDGDGVIDSVDRAPLDRFHCNDSDDDGCDDCQRGIVDALADGEDTDADGICDVAEEDDDGDGVTDTEDRAAHDPKRCVDSDADGCDDCASGHMSPHDDGPDLDADGLCDSGDPDADGDDVANADDAWPLSGERCADRDADGCDDCSTGRNRKWNDGPDNDLDGLCDDGDDDDDNDGVNDLVDTDPNDPLRCGDVDSDRCDDCELTGDDRSSGDPAHDGVDSDGDGICDIGEEDSDADGVADILDSDDDNDGIVDLREGSQDVDGDGMPNALDLDSDGDDLLDLTEAGGTDQNGDGRVDDFVDFDHDGLHDRLARRGQLGLQPRDTDGDSVPDFLDPLVGDDEATAGEQPATPSGGGCTVDSTNRGAPSMWLLPISTVVLRLRRRIGR